MSNDFSPSDGDQQASAQAPDCPRCGGVLTELKRDGGYQCVDCHTHWPAFWLERRGILRKSASDYQPAGLPENS